MPAPLTTFEDREQPIDAIPVLSGWIRAGVLIAAALLVTVFGIAIWLNPYDEEGHARRMETHRQLGLPPCTFKELTGLPCPSCGMTSSFALLVRGDVMNSLRANAVGTLLALLWAAAIPWLLACGVMGRPSGRVAHRANRAGPGYCVHGAAVIALADRVGHDLVESKLTPAGWRTGPQFLRISGRGLRWQAYRGI